MFYVDFSITLCYNVFRIKGNVRYFQKINIKGENYVS